MKENFYNERILCPIPPDPIEDHSILGSDIYTSLFDEMLVAPLKKSNTIRQKLWIYFYSKDIDTLKTLNEYFEALLRVYESSGKLSYAIVRKDLALTLENAEN